MRTAVLSLVSLAAIGTAAPAPAQPVEATCASTAGSTQRCTADTSGGVALQQATGTTPCLVGKTWGYDTGSIWVKDGCAGTFTLGGSAAAAPTPAPEPSIQSWGAVEPGKGFLVGKTKLGDLYISAYALVRYLNQMPSGQNFTDHLGRVHPVDARNDIYAHRIMVHLKGWIGLPKLVYQITLWTVNTTDQKALFAIIGYQFHRAFSLYGGLNGLPGTRTLLGSHPYWLGHDRVMADEFFRPFFTNGVWASGEVLPGLWYTGMIGDNLSALGITAGQLTRNFALSGTAWWMPTTHEFGPNGGFDDYEWHEELATRFGIAYTHSLENRFTSDQAAAPDNTTIRLGDSLNLFDPGALANGVTVTDARYRMFEADAGVKYHGIFVGAAYFQRWLDDFRATGPVPVRSLVDRGFYVQAAFYPVKQRLELYGATSWVFPEESQGFEISHEYLGGANWFFASTRNFRVNAQLIRVVRSPVSSTFGYYVGGQTGMTASLGVSILF